MRLDRWSGGFSCAVDLQVLRGRQAAGAVERLLALGQLAAALDGDRAAELGRGHGVARDGPFLLRVLRPVRRALTVGSGGRARAVDLEVLRGGQPAGAVQRLLALGQLAAAQRGRGATITGRISELAQLSGVGGVDRVHAHAQLPPPR
jgi:hypothetical protein